MNNSVKVILILMSSVVLASYNSVSANEKKEEQRILILGNSITAGFGLDINQAYPSLLQNKIDSLQYNYNVINAGLSGETTSGGLRRSSWLLKQPIDIFILALGANDGLRGINLELSKQNLLKIIKMVREKNKSAHIILAGMQVPPNIGVKYAQKFKDMYKEIASSEKIDLIPFLLQDVGGIKELNLPDRIHPNIRGQQIVAENVWRILQPLLKK